MGRYRQLQRACAQQNTTALPVSYCCATHLSIGVGITGLDVAHVLRQATPCSAPLFLRVAIQLMLQVIQYPEGYLHSNLCLK